MPTLQTDFKEISPMSAILQVEHHKKSSLSPTLFNMVINQLLHLNLGSKGQIIAHTDDMAIHGGPIGNNILYKQMTTALKKIKTKAMQLGLKFSRAKCEAIVWYSSNDPHWKLKIAEEEIPGHRSNISGSS